MEDLQAKACLLTTGTGTTDTYMGTVEVDAANCQRLHMQITKLGGK